MNELKKAFDLLGVKETEAPVTPMVLIKSRTIAGHTVSVIDVISKAIALGSLDSIISDLFIEKTGKDIKEKLVVVKQLDDSEAAMNFAMATAQLSKCDKVPTSTNDIDNYDLRGTKVKFGEVPKTFNWKDVNELDEADGLNQPTTTYGMEISKPSVRSYEDNPMRMYNKYIRAYVECRVESIRLDVIINGLTDSKVYKLTPNQATQLGF